MSLRDVERAIEDFVHRQNDGWKFVGGRESLGKEEFLKRVKRDKKFHRSVLVLVTSLSVDILGRKPPGA